MLYLVPYAVGQIRNFYYFNCSVGRQQLGDVNINLSGCEREIFSCMGDTSKGFEQTKQGILEFLINMPEFYTDYGL